MMEAAGQENTARERKPVETRKRSIMKSISWRITASMTTLILVYLFTGQWTVAGGVTLVEAIIKMAIYYVHERLWSGVEV